MSVKVIDAVFKHWDGPGGSVMLVLLALADFANDEGGSCYPSVERVARKARMSTVQARRLLHELERFGAISVVGNHTGGHRSQTRQYQINISAIVAGVAKATTALRIEKKIKRAKATGITGERRKARTLKDSSATDETAERVSPVNVTGVTGESQSVSNRQGAFVRDQELFQATPLRSVASSSKQDFDDRRPVKDLVSQISSPCVPEGGLSSPPAGRRFGSNLTPLMRMKLRRHRLHVLGYAHYGPRDIAALVQFGDINKRAVSSVRREQAVR